MQLNLKSFTFLFLFSSTLYIQAQVQVNPFAGSGTYGNANGTGAAASFGAPISLASDILGNIYVADNLEYQIRKISPTEVVTTLAGSGIGGILNGAGATAEFHSPSGVAADVSGNIYIADTYNNMIRKITPAGIVSTLAGYVYTGYLDGSGTNARFYYPRGVAVDASGNIYVADTENNMIRKITPAGVVSTVAGQLIPGSANGTGTAASFNGPQGIAIDVSGNLYIADSGNNQIRKISPAGEVTTLAGSGATGNTNGSGSGASFNFPCGITVDASGNVYIADTFNNIIRKITPTGIVTTLAGSGVQGNANGSGTSASFYGPQGLALDPSGNLYVGDDNDLVRKITGLSNVTAITQSVFYSDIKLYPIPTSNQLTLAVTIINEANITVESLPTGMYVANIYSGNEITSQKVVIAR